MKVQKIYFPIFCLVTILFLASCNIDGNKNNTAFDLANYVNSGILNIAQLEKSSLQKYSSVTGENYTTDESVYYALKDYVIPGYERYLNGLREIRTDSEEVAKVHKIYIYGAETMLSGFKTKMIGIEKGDEDITVLGNEKIEKGRVETEKWSKEIRALAKKYGVKEEKKAEN